ncbi:MAG: peptidylprolyl isomerase, partial [Acetobacteraceae bacterium]
MVRPAAARVFTMIGLMRRFLNTWVARVFFLILVIAFGAWGIGDMLRTLLQGGSSNTAVATLDGQSIEGAAFQDQFQRAIGRVQQALGGQQASPEIRREIASRTLDQMVAQVVLAHEVGRLGVVVPDPALRAAVFAMPPFRGANGQFDRTRFNAVLANNNLNEASFLQLMRADIAGRQVQEAVRAGAVVPATLLKQAFDVAQEKRVAAMVALPFAAAPAPPAPAEAQLRRFYALHPDSYSTPERRRIQAVVLSTETIARGMEIPEPDIRAYYDAHKADYVTPEKRSAQVIVAGDTASAQKLADQWKAGADKAGADKAGADWAAMQQA